MSRLLVVFIVVDVTFKLLVAPAYIEMVGGPMSAMLPAVVAVAAAALGGFLTFIALLGSRIDRALHAKERGELDTPGLRLLGRRLHALPYWIALAWGVEWVVFVWLATVVSESWTRSSIPVSFFLGTMVFAPLPLGYLLTVFVASPLVMRISLGAQRRGVVLQARPLTIRTQMTLFAVCVVLSPTLYMASIAFATRINAMSMPSLWFEVLLFIAAATLYAVLNAAFLGATMSSPIVQMTQIVRSIAKAGDVSHVERLPQVRHDEIGELAQSTNAMIDRLEQVECDRAALTRTLENRVEERTHHLEKANESLAHEMRARLKAELELRQAQKLESVGRLAAGIAHEINTPIQFVSNNVDFAKRSLAELLALVEQYRRICRAVVAGDAPESAVAEATRAEADIDLAYLVDQLPDALEQSAMGLGRVATIVKSMRQFAHDDHRGMVAIDINAALESTLVVSRHEYKELAELETDFAVLPSVTCHPGELNQAFLNIIVNAAHAIGSIATASGIRGKLVVRTRLEGSAVLISICDSGSGIPENVRDRIFDPFFTTKEVGKGTGQGLAIARAVLTELHDGELRFETETGKGTTFFIRLPVDGGRRALGRAA